MKIITPKTPARINSLIPDIQFPTTIVKIRNNDWIEDTLIGFNTIGGIPRLYSITDINISDNDLSNGTHKFPYWIEHSSDEHGHLFFYPTCLTTTIGTSIHPVYQAYEGNTTRQNIYLCNIGDRGWTCNFSSFATSLPASTYLRGTLPFQDEPRQTWIECDSMTGTPIEGGKTGVFEAKFCEDYFENIGGSSSIDKFEGCGRFSGMKIEFPRRTNGMSLKKIVYVVQPGSQIALNDISYLESGN